ncbi:uncharacterized protein LOC103844367 [Brassica rapa]|uniref:uncharacterized protein LOC103844367 n=1 Tax=Brassica campestris TaxID=3711 RepID=UPI00142D8BA7|nr:uncharacterized protein LOC103844367 [Brassica rapa]
MKSTQRASLEEGGNISSRSSKLTLIIIPFISTSSRLHPLNHAREFAMSLFEAPYVDPRTNLRYANAHVFKTLRSLSTHQVHHYLSIRNAAPLLK